MDVIVGQITMSHKLALGSDCRLRCLNAMANLMHYLQIQFIVAVVSVVEHHGKRSAKLSKEIDLRAMP